MVERREGVKRPGVRSGRMEGSRWGGGTRKEHQDILDRRETALKFKRRGGGWASGPGRRSEGPQIRNQAPGGRSRCSL